MNYYLGLERILRVKVARDLLNTVEAQQRCLEGALLAALSTALLAVLSTALLAVLSTALLAATLSTALLAVAYCWLRCRLGSQG